MLHMTTRPQRKPRALEEIEKIADPAERARAASEFIDYTVQRRRQGIDVRDAAIRDLRAAKVTIPDIAEQTGVNVNTVKAVLR